MNKLDKKVVDLYIKTNKVKEFVRKNPNYQEILYFSKHYDKNDLSILTMYVLETNNLDLIIDYAIYAEKISSVDITRIVHTILASKKAEYISRLARHARKLTSRNINLLTEGIILTKNYTEILRFYIEVENLSQANKESIFKAILESKNNKAMTDFIIRLPELTDDKIGELIDSLDDNVIPNYKRILTKLTYNNKYKLLKKVLNTNNTCFIFEFILNCGEFAKKNEGIIFDKLIEIGDIKAIIEYYCDIVRNYNTSYENKIVNLLKEYNNPQLVIYFLSKYTLLNQENINILEVIILKSSNKRIIATYLLLTKNKVLAEKIFGDLMYFYVYCKDVLKMDIKLEQYINDLEINVNETYTDYVDVNVEKINTKKM